MKITPKQDTRWIAMIQEGGRQENRALTEIYDQMKNMVFNYVQKKLSGNDEMAEEALMDALLVLSIKIHNGTYRGEASVKNFLLKVVRNICLNQLKRHQKFVPMDEEELLRLNPVQMEPELELLRNEVTRKLLKVLSTLKEGCLSIFKMFYWYGWSLQKIAVALNISSEDAVKSKKHRCAVELRKFFEDHPEIAAEFKNIQSWK
jgi:RNA polymerase sigma-70 factor (ECF subfamily)